MKGGVAFSVLFVGQALGFFGYSPETAHEPDVLFGMRLIYGPLVAAIMLFSIIIALFYPLTRKRHGALLEAIRAKKAGEPWDEEAIKRLL